MNGIKNKVGFFVFFVFVINSIIAQAPPKELKAEEFLKKAAEFMGKDNKKALDLLNQALKIDPKYGIAYSGRGIVYHDMKKYNRAITEHNKAIKLDPTYLPAYLNKGGVYRDMKKYARAIAEYDKAIKLDPAYCRAYLARGDIYCLVYDYEFAISDFTKAIEIDPMNAYAYTRRARAYGNRYGSERKSFDDYGKAINIFISQIDKLPENINELKHDLANTYYYRSKISMADGYIGDAISDLEYAVELEPSNEHILYSLGDLKNKRIELIKEQEQKRFPMILLEKVEHFFKCYQVIKLLRIH
ncbi:hypothetical protein AGMMS50212_10120 [Spirochaetia bacterium]|nr:hypothetical protein AGMMS50212_10120 [Spirochaetia bacterium]